MAKRTKSARGAIVDFDLFNIKQQIASAPTPATVAARENFVEQRLKRRTRRLKRESTAAINQDTDQITPLTEERNNAGSIVTGKQIGRAHV